MINSFQTENGLIIFEELFLQNKIIIYLPKEMESVEQ